MDFNLTIYRELLKALKQGGYEFQTFSNFIKKPKNKVVILRHDVDLLPKNSLVFAEIQNSMGISGTYYFRAVPESWDNKIIKKIDRLGHEVGYHYECLTTVKGDFKKGIQDFKRNLEDLRKLTNVSSICMHGSPMSKFDSKDLWKKYNYKDFGLVGEPYFDVNFDKVFYLTDTGRKWDGSKVSVRDKVNTKFQLSFHSTEQIVSALKMNKLPDQLMLTFHPQRWHDEPLLWTKELIFQNVKNIVKRYVYISN